jgi:hypothetical protein
MNLSLSRLTVVCYLAWVRVWLSAGPHAMQQSRFDQSWAAASGAIYDQGLTITMQDRSTGVIRGERGDTSVTATLEDAAGRCVQVKFSGKGGSHRRRSGVPSFNRRRGA